MHGIKYCHEPHERESGSSPLVKEKRKRSEAPPGDKTGIKGGEKKIKKRGGKERRSKKGGKERRNKKGSKERRSKKGGKERRKE